MNTTVSPHFQSVLILLAITFCLPLGLHAQNAKSLEFGILKESYEKKLQEVAAEVRENEIVPLMEKYDAALARLEDAEAAAGRLESVVALRAERERAKMDAGVSKAQISKDEPAIATLQGQLLKQLDEISVGQRRRCAKVSDVYVEKLKELKLRLTQQKKIAQAVAVDNELKRVIEELKKQRGPKTDFFAKKDEEDERTRFLGEWTITRYDGYDVCQAKIAKAGKGKVEITSNSEWAKGIVGDYLVEGKNLRKVRRDGDASWDIFWKPDRREFLNNGSHYPKYRLTKQKTEKTE